MSDTTITVGEDLTSADAALVLRIGSPAQCRCGALTGGEVICDACMAMLSQALATTAVAHDRLARYFQCPTCRPRRRAKLLWTRTNARGEVLGKSWRCRRCGEHSEGRAP